MTKLLRGSCLAILAVFSFGLAGCQLYFGEDDNVSDPGSRPPGTKCEANAQCAAGCFCAEGVCEEAGFCSNAVDCPPGYMCDERSSCVPNANPTCESATDCLAGSTCEDGHCNPTCVCESDADAVDQGYHHCDEARSTCENASALGSCLGAVTCTNAKPVCPQGSVPLIANACWADSDANGQPDCSAIGACDITPVCASRQYEADCPSSCTIVKKGINCTMPGGGSCQDGVPGCVCAMYVFDSCR